MSRTSTGRAAFSQHPFESVKVFSATMVNERERLGDRINEWLAEHPAVELCEAVVTQSSDASYHCVAITLFYRGAA